MGLGTLAAQAGWAPMPRYFFHTQDGDAHRDGEGMSFADMHTAKLEGLKTMGQLLKDGPEEVLNGHGSSLS